jgi:uncharacterized membrane protein YgcG
MKIEVALFTEITVEESATVSGGDAAADLIKAQLNYLKTNNVQIAPSSGGSTGGSGGSTGGSGGSTVVASVNALANPVVKLPVVGS